MTERQKDELSSIPIGKMLVVQKELRDVGRVRAAQLLDYYEERLAIIAEGRDATPEDIEAAWESALNVKFVRRWEHDDEGAVAVQWDRRS